MMYEEELFHLRNTSEIHIVPFRGWWGSSLNQEYTNVREADSTGNILAGWLDICVTRK